jgi:hypothetical protein
MKFDDAAFITGTQAGAVTSVANSVLGAAILPPVEGLAVRALCKRGAPYFEVLVPSEADYFRCPAAEDVCKFLRLMRWHDRMQSFYTVMGDFPGLPDDRSAVVVTDYLWAGRDITSLGRKAGCVVMVSEKTVSTAAAVSVVASLCASAVCLQSFMNIVTDNPQLTPSDDAVWRERVVSCTNANVHTSVLPDDPRHTIRVCYDHDLLALQLNNMQLE